jgi:hypothetical protein
MPNPQKENYPVRTILTLSVYTDNERIFDVLCAGVHSKSETAAKARRQNLIK